MLLHGFILLIELIDCKCPLNVSFVSVQYIENVLTDCRACHVIL